KSPWSRNLPISGGTSTPPKVLRVDSSASCEGDFRRRRDQLGKPTFSTTSTLELSGARLFARPLGRNVRWLAKMPHSLLGMPHALVTPQVNLSPAFGSLGTLGQKPCSCNGSI